MELHEPDDCPVCRLVERARVDTETDRSVTYDGTLIADWSRVGPLHITSYRVTYRGPDGKPLFPPKAGS